MNSKDEARHSSLIETKTFVDPKGVIWNLDPSFTADYTAYQSKLAAIELQKQKHLTILIGFTVDKINKEGILINDLMFIMGRLQVWASPTNSNRPDVRAAATISDSDLLKLADTILLSKAGTIKNIIDDTVGNPGIVPAFITLLQKTDFYQHILDYEAVYQIPEDKIDERAVATKAMTEGIKDAIDFRKNILLPDAKFWRISDPDFFNGFKQSMKIDNNPTQKYSFIGEVKEEPNEATVIPLSTPAVANVTVLIVELNLTARTGEKGNFIFKSVPAGQYRVMFLKYGFEQLQRTVFINDNERTVLKVNMRKLNP